MPEPRELARHMERVIKAELTGGAPLQCGAKVIHLPLEPFELNRLSRPVRGLIEALGARQEPVAVTRPPPLVRRLREPFSCVLPHGFEKPVSDHATRHWFHHNERSGD
jgi:hypothetical protein